VVVRLDPGLAFGTGTHPSTALCLNWLDAADLAGKTVIDYGCGSGILAIAAAKLGAAQVWAVDIDPQALIATAGNAAANAVADRIVILPPEALVAPPVDILLANILAGPLGQLAPRFATLVKPGGQVVLAGLLARQTDAVMLAYRQAGFAFGPPQAQDDWRLLQASHHAG
jgi:ribosomal protein L11 methyltransferase